MLKCNVFVFVCFLFAGCGKQPNVTSQAANQVAAKRPNILFVIADDQSFPHTSASGYKAINTPAFDRVAKEGILFTNAFVASPGCSPSRAALLTGRNCWQIAEAGTHASSFPASYATFPDLLESAGYRVGFTGKGWAPGNFEISGRSRNPAGPAYNNLKAKGPEGISNLDYAANFADFLSRKNKNTPFCFWFGASEPHRPFSKGIGLKNGKKLADVQVPGFLPDTPEVKSDLLDYCYEIEWYDQHLGRMLKMLEAAGELDNTIVVVTADNGMAFPRAKANAYEYGIHVPLAIRWGNRIPGNRTIDNVVSLIDLAPTFLDAAGVAHPSMKSGQYPMAGFSMLPVLLNKRKNPEDTLRTAVYASRERHSYARYDNMTYPVRALRTAQYLYIRNFKPERWPAGDPQKLELHAASGKLAPGPMHGAYHDIDACPTLDFLVANQNDRLIAPFLQLAVAKRPAEELYDIKQDPACLHNLIAEPAMSAIHMKLKGRMDNYLQTTQDPRVTGKGEVFETYPRYEGASRAFPPPAAGVAPGPSRR